MRPKDEDFMTGNLDRLGSILAKNDVPADVKESKDALLAGVSAKMNARKSSRRFRYSLGAAAAVLVALLGVLSYSLSRSSVQESDTMNCTMGGSTLAEGAWIDVREKEGAELIFEGAGGMKAIQGTRLRLSKLNSQDVNLTLENGRLTFDIDHKLGRAWAIQAGPYQVEVVGTSFDLSWKPSEKAIRVTVRRGVVQVSGEELQGRAMLVRAGEDFTSSPGSHHLVRQKEASIPAEKSALAQKPPSNGADGDSASSTPEIEKAQLKRPLEKTPAKKKVSPVTPHKAQILQWSELANQERYKDAVQAAETMGYEELLSKLEADALLRLADVARLAKRNMRSQQALMELRVRFRGHPGRLSAAFRLGRINYDQQAYTEAVKWFETYVDEAGGGGLTAEARGRLIDLWIKLDDIPEATHAAEDYLKHHKGGNYTALAQQVISSP